MKVYNSCSNTKHSSVAVSLTGIFSEDRSILQSQLDFILVDLQDRVRQLQATFAKIVKQKKATLQGSNVLKAITDMPHLMHVM